MCILFRKYHTSTFVSRENKRLILFLKWFTIFKNLRVSTSSGYSYFVRFIDNFSRMTLLFYERPIWKSVCLKCFMKKLRIHLDVLLKSYTLIILWNICKPLSRLLCIYVAQHKHANTGTIRNDIATHNIF